jgi:phosphinothricin acetyltransferase
LNIEFKYAQPVDLLKVVQTYNSTIESRMVTADTEVVSVDDKKKWFDSHSAEKRPLWLVIADGEYAGWMSFSSFYGRPAYDGTVEVSIYLEQHARGKGIGKKCLQKVLIVHIVKLNL